MSTRLPNRHSQVRRQNRRRFLNGYQDQTCQRRLQLELLEERRVLTSTLYVDFGDDFPVAGLTGTLGTLKTATSGVAGDPAVAGPVMAGSLNSDWDIGAAGATNDMTDADTFNLTGFNATFIAQGGTAAGAGQARAQMMAYVRRFYEPFDIDVIELTSASVDVNGRLVTSANTLAEISSTLGANETTPKNNDAYVLVGSMIVHRPAGSGGDFNAASQWGGYASTQDMPNNNNTDNSAIAYLGTSAFTASDFTGFWGGLIAHEAGHTFGLQHSLTTTPSGAVSPAIPTSEVMSYLGGNGFKFFSRYPMVRGNGNTTNNEDLQAVGAPVANRTPYDQFALAPSLGANPDFNYVTGTGAHDIITLTKTGANATVTVRAFSNATYTTALAVPGSAGASTTYTYTLGLDRPILIDGGDLNDRIVLDGDLGVDITVRGMAGTDSLVINSKTLPSRYTPSNSNPLGLDGNSDVRGTIQIGGATIQYQEFENTSSVSILNAGTFTYATPGTGADALTVSLNAAGNPQITGTVSDGVAMLPLEVTGQRLSIETGPANDVVTVDSTSGLVALTLGIDFDGGAGFDRLNLTQTAGTARTNDRVIVGANPGDGQSIIDTQIVNFRNIEPVTDNVPAATFAISSVAGIASLLDASNAINYEPAEIFPPATWGRVTVDNFEPVEFINKTNLVIDAGAGTDTINLNNPNTPTGLTTITVNGGDPTSSDTLVINGRAGFQDQIRLLPTGAGAGSITQTGVPTRAFTGIENIRAVMDALASDHFTVDGTANNDHFRIASGPATGETTITGEMNGVGGVGFLLPTIIATGQSNTLIGTFNFNGVGGTDTMTVTGTGTNDVFNFFRASATAGSIDHDINGVQTSFIGFANLARLIVEGGDGDDQFVLPGNFPTPLQVNGGNPAAGSDILRINGVNATAENFTVTPAFDPGSGTVLVNTSTTAYSGVEHLQLFGLNTDQDNLLVNDDGRDNVWNVQPGANLDDLIQIQGRESIDFENFNNVTLNNTFGTDTFNVYPTGLVEVIGTLIINGDATAPIDDQINLYGTSGKDVATSTATAVNLNGTSVTIGTNIRELRVLTLGGSDNVDLDLDLPGADVTYKYVDAGNGDDIVNLSGTVDATIIGGAGDDFLTGTPDFDTIDGGAGNDFIFGLGNNDDLYGGDGSDLIVGGAGADRMYGQTGADTLVWNPGDGNDLFEGGEGEDILQFVGGAGADTFTMTANGTRLRFDRQPGNIVIDAAGMEQVDVNSGISFAGTLTGAQENPPVATAATGSTALVFNSATGTFELEILVQGITLAQLQDSHIHSGAVGVNGPVIFPIGTAGWVDVGGAIRRIVNLGVFPAANIADLLAGNTYVNIQTVANPTGEIRGQLTAVSGAPNLNGGDTFTVNDLYPTEVRVVNLGMGVIDAGAVDTVTVQARNVADAISVSLATATRAALTGLRYDVNVDAAVAADNDILIVNGNDGHDHINAADALSALYSAANLRINGGDGDDAITGHGLLSGGAGNDWIVGGDATQTINGDAGDDVLFGGAGDDTLNGGAGEDLFVGGAGADTIDGGADFDTIRVPGTSGTDIISVNQTAATTLVHTVNGDTQTDTLVTIAGVRTVESVRVEAGAGADAMSATWADALGTDALVNSLRIDVVGGADGAFDRLGVIDNGTGDLVLYRKGVPDTSGAVTTGPANAEPLELTFVEVEFLQPVAAANGQVEVFKHDPYEFNDAQNISTHLGAGSVINIDPTIDPGALAALGLPADQDFFRVEAQYTGTLDFSVFFNQIATVPSGRPGLPGNGDLNIEVRDVAGNVITGFGTNDATSDERVRIPAVQGQLYFLRVFGATGAAVNNYTATIINTPAPRPFDLELDDDPANGTTNPPGQADNSDTGRSQDDNITYDNTPTIVFRVPDSELVADIPDNSGNPGSPVNGVRIPIPFVGSTAANAPSAGFRVAVFRTEANTRLFVGYATALGNGVYSFTFPAAIPDGSNFISARVEMIDPASPEQNQGFGAFATADLEIRVDTVVPPVFFGQQSIATDGLHPDSDSGVLGPLNVATLSDGITNDATPTFWGRAEADANIRAYLDVNNNGTVELATDIFLGFTTAVPYDGTNQLGNPAGNEPNGYWQLTSVVNLNSQAVLTALGIPAGQDDGLRRILVSAEDVAGNITSGAAQVQLLNVFLDTQGPQVTSVFVTGSPTYDLFDPKPSTDGPTPLVNSLSVRVQDFPARLVPGIAGLTDYPAVQETIAEIAAHYQVRGDYNGIIPISSVTFTGDAPINGQPARGTIVISFLQPLPDDRFTLTIQDDVVDPAGNRLDGESNASEPQENPLFPSGDGVPGGDFVARFTVDTRPELGVWASGSAWIDTNGNQIFDPDNLDFTNRDIAYLMGYTSDKLFAGNFAANGALAADGFDKLAAYGRVGSTWRWQVDTDNDGVPNIEVVDPSAINGFPVAGNFDAGGGGGFAGDEVGLFTGNTWFLDTDHDFQVNDPGGSRVISWPVLGYGFTGDFDGDGRYDLGTWTDDTFQLSLSSLSGGLVDGVIDRTFFFGFAGARELPVAADMNMDGIDDIGLWNPDRSTQIDGQAAEWYWLISGVTTNDTPPGGGALGPTIAGAFGAAPPNGRIVPDPITLGRNLVKFTPTPFGNDLYMQYGDEFALPIVGNFDPPATVVVTTPGTNTRDPLDVNNDGKITAFDALEIINQLNLHAGPYATPTGGFSGAPFLDVDHNSNITAFDALNIINWLNLNPIVSGSGGESAGESVDALLKGSDDRLRDNRIDDSLLEILAGDGRR